MHPGARPQRVFPRDLERAVAGRNVDADRYDAGNSPISGRTDDIIKSRLLLHKVKVAVGVEPHARSGLGLDPREERVPYRHLVALRKESPPPFLGKGPVLDAALEAQTGPQLLGGLGHDGEQHQ